MPKTTTPAAGTFEFIERLIRNERDAAHVGRGFEWLCKWYLENAPLYRGLFRKVWRWVDWPDRWGRDCGIDLIAETTDDSLWAIQCKAVSPEHHVSKSEVDSFLSESNRREISYRLLIATTDEVGHNARRTIESQSLHASLVLRGDLATADLKWPSALGGRTSQPSRCKPRPHQSVAIRKVLNGFRKHARGRLIMACGTGKTLTGMWISEGLQSKSTLWLVPSLSLVQQTLKEWGRNAKHDFDILVVCSDDSVANHTDASLRHVTDLGFKPTTVTSEIAGFLSRSHSRPTLVVSTYQSCSRVAAAQIKARNSFDLIVCDEAHRLVGDAHSPFATALDDQQIRGRYRLFLTATPRYLSTAVKRRGLEQDLELVSMDDLDRFGPEFHVLTFQDAITASPPLLSDYRVVVVGVTNSDVRSLARIGRRVTTDTGLVTDAHTLGAQLGVAKALKKYDLRSVITFHRTLRRASNFVDVARPESLPSIIRRMRTTTRPSGLIWARHISGDTPASKRAALLRELAEVPGGRRHLISNCSCLGEGVDVPALDGIAFIDPKYSMVDIIQAVGRVIRLSPRKRLGTIIIPVFIGPSEDADRALESSKFEPVWQVLRALRAHDSRLAYQLDTLRGDLTKDPSRIRSLVLPPNITIDVPRLVFAQFEKAFFVRAIERASVRPPLTLDEILAWADAFRQTHLEWPKATSGEIPATEETWLAVDEALRRGGRGVGREGSLAQCLARHRGKRYSKGLPPLRHDQILRWAEHHRQQHGKWPTQYSGAVDGTEEVWNGIQHSLRTGRRGLPGNETLASVLARHRGARYAKGLPRLTVNQILDWADSHHRRTGEWPNKRSGSIPNTPENWYAVNAALHLGSRGLSGGITLPQLLKTHRRVRNRRQLPPLSVEKILRWADAHHRRTGRWPQQKSGAVEGTHETWGGIDRALASGTRGMPRKTTLASLLHLHRKVRNVRALPQLTVKQILQWADAHKARTGEWPKQRSGQIGDTGEKWGVIGVALANGGRGLSGGSSLAQLLSERRGARNHRDLATLSEQQILKWADAFKAATGNWPRRESGQIPGTDETWSRVNGALQAGRRGLTPGSSLAALLDRAKGIPNKKRLPPMTVPGILVWAEEHRKATGSFPNARSGRVGRTRETWAKVNVALLRGYRGLPGGVSLATLLARQQTPQQTP
jgi:superfamily II DNA or RNA helicase